MNSLFLPFCMKGVTEQWTIPPDGAISIIRAVCGRNGCIVLERAGKREVLDKLIRLLSGPGGAGEECEIARGIHARERLLSTGIGFGVAIPHVRLASVRGLEIAAALVRGGRRRLRQPGRGAGPPGRDDWWPASTSMNFTCVCFPG